jgi:hypothetical protein
MNRIKYLAAVALLLAGCAVSFYAGRMYSHSCHERDYQAACILSDCCHNMVDNLGLEAEEIYCEYVDNLDCYPEITVTREQITNYHWVY